MFMAGAMIFQSVPTDLFLHVVDTTLVGTESVSGLLVEWGIALPAVRFPGLNGFRFRITHGNPSCIAALKGADSLCEHHHHSYPQ
jgi:hypothetical protein